MLYDLIIIGGGPAGMSAGIYAARQKLNALLITKDFGGQLMRKSVEIENYPGLSKISAEQLIKKFKEHLMEHSIVIELGKVKKVEKNKHFSVFVDDKKVFNSKKVLIASGADPRSLEIPGEKEFLGKGVSYCTICDAPLFKDKITTVVGGGNAGLEAAFNLSQWSKKVYILESRDKIAADSVNQEIVKKIPKIEIIVSVKLKKIKGEKFVNSIEYEDSKTGKLKNLSVDGIFVEIGSIPATNFVKELVDFNEKNEIKVDFETYETKTPGLFAVGDCNSGQYKQIVIACGEGVKAVLFINEQLKKNEN